MHKDLEKVLLTKEEIAARVHEMGQRITADYAGKSILLCCILKGAVTFLPTWRGKSTCPSNLISWCVPAMEIPPIRAAL